MNEHNYEILIYMSDQHSGLVTGYAGDNDIIHTPNLNRIARNSTVFTRAYTSAPICVPARASFMTSRLPSSVGVYGNNSAYASDNPTFIHALGLAGYETILCGRMHFMGMDQRHGFQKRIANDITPTHWGYVYTGAPQLQKGGHHTDETTLYKFEDNTAYYYDKYVTDTAIAYLNEYHSQKQAIVVGTYMPHMPLGGPQEKVNYYYDKVMKNFHSIDTKYPFDGSARRPCYKHLKDPDTLRKIRANYYAMVETEDELIGQVYNSFCNYLKQYNREGIFIYLSDHGDQMGEKGYIGKRVFFEDSVRIPLIIQFIDSNGLPKQQGQSISTPVSIMDIGPTLCSLTAAPPIPHSNGRDLSSWLLNNEELTPELPVLSEFFGPDEGFINHCAGVMVRYKSFKYITYTFHEDQDLLFDLKHDPWELRNVILQYPDILEKMKHIVKKEWPYLSYHLEKSSEAFQNIRLLSQWGCYFPKLNETWEFF